MFDTGKVFNNNPVLYPDPLIGTASRGLRGSTKAILNQGQPSGKSSKPNADVPINASKFITPSIIVAPAANRTRVTARRDGGFESGDGPGKDSWCNALCFLLTRHARPSVNKYAALDALGEYIYGDKWDAAQIGSFPNERRA